MLEIKNLVKIFNKGTINERVALNGVNLTLNDGDLLPFFLKIVLKLEHFYIEDNQEIVDLFAPS